MYVINEIKNSFICGDAVNFLMLQNRNGKVTSIS